MHVFLELGTRRLLTVRPVNWSGLYRVCPTPSFLDLWYLNIHFKVFVLLQVSILSALGFYNAAIINPAYSELGTQFGISTITASYQTSVSLRVSRLIESKTNNIELYNRTLSIATNGICPFLWIPFANTFGRRPVYLAATLLGVLSALGCAYAQNFGQLVGLRILNGLFPVAYVYFLRWFWSDPHICLYSQNCIGCGNSMWMVNLVFKYPRLKVAHRQTTCSVFTNVGALWEFTLFCQVSNTFLKGLSPSVTRIEATGAHLAPIPGGLIGQFLGWRWIFKFAAITNSFCLLFTFFFLPETLYIRDPKLLSAHASNAERTFLQRYLARMRLYGRYPGRKLRLGDFFLPYFKMIRYVRLELFL